MTSAIRAILSQTAIVFLTIQMSCTAWAKEISGRVVAIADGDTATVLVAGNRQVRVRLAAIDAPEQAQPFGNRSKEALSRLIFGKEVTVKVTDTDRYKRTLGIIILAALGMAQENIGYAVAIPSWRFKAAGRGVLKTAALSTDLACSHGHFRSSGQAQEEVMTLNALRFIAAQDRVKKVFNKTLHAHHTRRQAQNMILLDETIFRLGRSN